ncbi:hypothetical protein OH805_35205 [Streptomyces sp. NBC_00879]|uniref:hypothetical protein n=1 Tax=Streptomyces sp. NBC_00879 TaxID=2975855 RepID=UPI003864AC47|nr:hypothetical protein OH805_35205 [Streptomyces sp. NBC_00879]
MTVPTALPFARRFLAEAARTPVNLLTLILAPVVFVVVAAGPMADAAELLAGPGGPAVQTATAGWAAGFIAAVAMYFQIRAARWMCSSVPPSARQTGRSPEFRSRVGDDGDVELPGV